MNTYKENTLNMKNKWKKKKKNMKKKWTKMKIKMKKNEKNENKLILQYPMFGCQK